MREKLLNLMKSEGLTSSRLAEILGIQPSGISHILAGRNKPGFDLLQKILRRFPRINPDWLLLDSDKMYRDAALAETAGTRQQTTETSQNFRTPEDLFATAVNAGESHASTPAGNISASSAATRQAAGNTPFPESTISALRNTVPNTEVVRVVIFYADRTFESFSTKQ